MISVIRRLNKYALVLRLFRIVALSRANGYPFVLVHSELELRLVHGVFHRLMPSICDFPTGANVQQIEAAVGWKLGYFKRHKRWEVVTVHTMARSTRAKMMIPKHCSFHGDECTHLVARWDLIYTPTDHLNC